MRTYLLLFFSHSAERMPQIEQATNHNRMIHQLLLRSKITQMANKTAAKIPVAYKIIRITPKKATNKIMFSNSLFMSQI